MRALKMPKDRSDCSFGLPQDDICGLLFPAASMITGLVRSTEFDHFGPFTPSETWLSHVSTPASGHEQKQALIAGQSHP